MFDTLKLIYTQDEALELVSKYEKKYKEELDKLEEENRNLKEELSANKQLANIYFNKYNDLDIENIRLQSELENIKKRVKEHTTYSVKAEFEKKFLD